MELHSSAGYSCGGHGGRRYRFESGLRVTLDIFVMKNISRAASRVDYASDKL
mgnify:CR=1 FL=1